jgi:enamine deaminase RidA (YjgF/YER057c/UK114 family)
MWIGSSENAGGNISGMHVFAVSGVHVDTIYENSEPIGRVFDDGQTRHCLLSGLKPANLSASKRAQYQEVVRNLERALRKADMSITDVVRTWFLLNDIHSWYGEFNNARTEFLKGRRLGLLPASTGIGSQNPARAAILAGAWAMQPAKSVISITETPSPLQCSSMEYGSAFSRAVLVDTPSCRRLLISGTASIGPDGRSAHVADLRKQIALTIKVARAILISCKFDFHDVTRATAYLKSVHGAPVLDEWQREHDLDFFPLVVAQADICRPELLFELELDAIS